MSSTSNEVPLSAAILTLTEDLYELEELAKTAGFEVLYEIIQRKNRSNPLTFVGKGKFERVRRLLEDEPVNALLINGDLRPTQHYNLENTFKVECIDRIGLVLRIFAEKANDKKGKLQVEKARLEYEIPLLREWIHSAKMGEHPGFLGSGEYQVDVYYDLVRKRMKKIDDELETIDLREDLRRKERKERGFFLVGIAGYTNAGKSSLLKRLTGERVLIDDRLFSTLSTTTRRMNGVKKDILVSDTIGFLRDLPHFLIDSFITTIKDIYLSDLVLLVVDSSDTPSTIRRKVETSKQILIPRVSPANILIVMNKTDLDHDGIRRKMGIVEEIMPNSKIISISLTLERNIDALLNFILDFFKYSSPLTITLPNTPIVQPFVSHLFDDTDIISISYGEKVVMRVNCREKDLSEIEKRVKSLGGTAVTTPPNSQ